MKPIIQGPLDALDTRIKALESLSSRFLAAASSLASLVTRVGTGRLLLGRRVLSGSGTYVPTSGTTRIIVRMVSGGGGGGGGSGGGGVACGSGGGSGVYAELILGDGVTLLRGGSYSCGSGGSAGSSLGGTGGTGGSTSLIVNETTYTCTGGTGGTGQTNTAASHAPPVGRAQTGPSAATFLAGEDGDHGVYAASDGYFWGGQGGSNPMGSGGGAVDGGNNGRVGFGFGSGGGGASATTVGKVGGDGTSGLIIVDEFA